MACSGNIYIGNDTQIDIVGLHNGKTSAYMNAATVTVILKDLSGVNVTGVSWPVTLSYESGTDGNYSGSIDKAASITDGTSYFAEITAEEGGIDGFWRIRLLAQYRKS